MTSTFTPLVIARQNKIVIIANIVLVLAGICQLVALVTPGWLYAPDDDALIGLFVFCGAFMLDLKTESLSECNMIPMEDTITSLHAVRGLVILTCILAILSTALCSGHIWLMVKRDKISHLVVSASVLLALLAVLVTVVTCIVFGASTKQNMPRDDDPYDLSYSFVLYVIGGALLLLGAGLEVASVKSVTKLLFV